MVRVHYQAVRAMRRCCGDKINQLDIGMECDIEMGHGYLPDNYHEWRMAAEGRIVEPVAARFGLTAEELIDMEYIASMVEHDHFMENILRRRDFEAKSAWGFES